MKPHPTGEPLRVTFFGDSICVGQGVSIHAGWVTRIAQELDRIGGAHVREMLVINASQNGSTTRQALERMPYEVQSLGVDILIVQFGLNDCNYWLTDGGLPRVSPTAFAANLKEIVLRGRAFGARHIFLNNNHPTVWDREKLPKTSITFEQSNRHYNQIVRDVAAEFGSLVELNDIEAAFDHATQADRERLKPLLLNDGLHLSLKGHDLYFDTVSDKIRCCVETCAGTDKQ